MRRIVGISVAATLAVPLMMVGVGTASADQQDVGARHSSGLLGKDGGLLGLGGGDSDGLLGTGLLGDRDDRKDRKKSSKKSKKDRRDRDEQANSIAGLNLLGDGKGDLLGLGGDDGLLGTGLLGDGDGLLGTGLLGGGDRDRNGTKRSYDNRDDDNGFPLGDD